jgi:hypothetical protein
MHKSINIVLSTQLAYGLINTFSYRFSIYRSFVTMRRHGVEWYVWCRLSVLEPERSDNGG